MAAGKLKFRFFRLVSFVCITITTIASTAEGNDDPSTAPVAVEEQKRMARNVESELKVAANPAEDAQAKNPPLARKKRYICDVCHLFEDPIAMDRCHDLCDAGHIRGREIAMTSCPGCGTHYSPVCGTDGIMYRNPCLAGCKGVTIAHPGPCYVNSSPTGRCACTREYNPVCGSDGKSYGNPCELRCAGVSRAHWGLCYFYSNVSGRCVCTKEYNPVCGDDGIEYDNPCLLRCAGAINVGPAVYPGGGSRGCYFYR